MELEQLELIFYRPSGDLVARYHLNCLLVEGDLMHKMNFHQRTSNSSTEHANKPQGSVVLLIGAASIVLAWLLEPILGGLRFFIVSSLCLANKGQYSAPFCSQNTDSAPGVTHHQFKGC